MSRAYRVKSLDHDPIKLNRIMISSLCLSMIFSENRFPLFRIMLLERQQHVHHLLTVTRLLHVGELAMAAIGDAGLRDLA